MPVLLLSFIIILSVLICNLQLQKKITNIVKMEKKQWIKRESNIVAKKMLVMWIEKKVEKEDIVYYFRKRGIFRIAIYGMTEVGILLYKVLKGTDILVVSGIDRSRKILNLSIDIFLPNEFHESVDAIVVSSTYYFSEIYDVLCESVASNVPILGLDEILFDIIDEKKEFIDC